MLLFGQEVQPSSIDDIAVFWTDGHESRAIVDAGYAEALAALERVLDSLPGSEGMYESLKLKVGELIDSGSFCVAVLGVHRIGLMRPFIHGDLRDGDLGDDPWILCCRQTHRPPRPVLCGSWDAAQTFAKTAVEMGLATREGWTGLHAERPRHPIAQLFARRDGQLLLHSELEERLNRTLEREHQLRTERLVEAGGLGISRLSSGDAVPLGVDR